MRAAKLRHRGSGIRLKYSLCAGGMAPNKHAAQSTAEGMAPNTHTRMLLNALGLGKQHEEQHPGQALTEPQRQVACLTCLKVLPSAQFADN
eukprot:1157728-Pelagomonas_calceolata.AAC.5